MLSKTPFVKMHASGNDFIIVDNRLGKLYDNPPEIVRKLCRRRFSVGADGMIFIENSDVADFRWHFFNLDGGEVEMCGNGSRCAARFAYMKGIAGRKMAFETLAGIIHAEVKEDTVKVQLTKPFGYRAGFPMELGTCRMDASFLNTGVPHVVYFVDDLAVEDVCGVGAKTRYHDEFAPAGTNANFVKVSGRNDMEIRTYERGVESETLACGTGATAAALVAGARGLVESPVRMKTQGGGTLTVYFDWDGTEFTDVYLEGDAVLVYQGVFEEGAFL